MRVSFYVGWFCVIWVLFPVPDPSCLWSCCDWNWRNWFTGNLFLHLQKFCHWYGETGIAFRWSRKRQVDCYSWHHPQGVHPILTFSCSVRIIMNGMFSLTGLCSAHVGVCSEHREGKGAVSWAGLRWSERWRDPLWAYPGTEGQCCQVLSFWEGMFY